MHISFAHQNDVIFNVYKIMIQSSAIEYNSYLFTNGTFQYITLLRKYNQPFISLFHRMKTPDVSVTFTLQQLCTEAQIMF